MEPDEVEIKLTKDEAIVLFEFLSRFSDSDELKIIHQSEERALWNLTCVFESTLSEPFRENYGEILEAARERLKDDPE
ncbi:MAG: hypothetical protein AB1Z31_07485 [Desulfobacterales bacterium]